ncbi:MAG: methyltransferase, partial [Myxococcota bacterium]
LGVLLACSPVETESIQQHTQKEDVTSGSCLVQQDQQSCEEAKETSGVECEWIPLQEHGVCELAKSAAATTTSNIDSSNESANGNHRQGSHTLTNNSRDHQNGKQQHQDTPSNNNSSDLQTPLHKNQVNRHTQKQGHQPPGRHNPVHPNPPNPAGPAPRRAAGNIQAVIFNNDVKEMKIYQRVPLLHGMPQFPAHANYTFNYPIFMSHGYLGSIVGNKFYISYDNVSMLFDKPARATFMKPSIDTALMMYGLKQLFNRPGQQFTQVHDVGSGSGLIGKYMATNAPGAGPLNVTLIDIDPMAMQFAQSNDAAMPQQGQGGRVVNMHYVVGNALTYIPGKQGLLVSNPPYIPTQQEVANNVVSAAVNNFYAGVGFIIELIRAVQNNPNHTEAVIIIPSTSMKSLAVQQAITNLHADGLQAEILVEREIGFKSFFLGGARPDLQATGNQIAQRQHFGNVDMYVGITTHARMAYNTQAGNAAVGSPYKWHVVYVMRIYR